MMKYFLSLMLLLFAATKPLTAQNTIEILSEIPRDLTDAQLQDYGKYLNIPNSHGHRIIQFGKIETVQKDGQISIKVPSTERPFTFQAKRVEYQGTRDYVWEGARLEGNVEYPDHLILTMTNGLLSGEASTEDHFYRILPISENYQVMFEMTDEDGIVCGNRLNMSGEDGGTGEMAPCTMNADECRINVMIAYTNAVQLAYPNVLAIGRTLVEQVNTAMRRSKIKHRWRLVDVVPVIDTWNNLDADGELDQLKDLLSTNTFIRNDRENSNADVVVVLSMGDNFGDVAGIAFGSPPTPEYACAVVKIAAGLGPRLTFTHELGHTLGAQHDDETCCLPARAHQFTSPITEKTYKTVLHSLDIGQRILNYSNPDVSYFGVSTGETERNNACIMQNQGCAIAQLLSSGDCFFGVSGLFDAECKSEALFLSVSAGDNFPQTCNTEGLYYSFEYSLDGINFTFACSGNDPFCDLSFNPPLFYNQTVFVRTTVSNSTGILAINFDWFTQKCPYVPVLTPDLYRLLPTTSLQEEDGLVELALAPNVTFENVTLQSSHVQTIRSIKIVDIFGNVVQQFENIDMTENQFTISLRDLPAGTYFAVLDAGLLRKTLKMIKM